MKKYFLIVFCALLLVVTGCGNKNQVKCTGTTTEGGITVKAEVIADLDNDSKVKDVTAVMDLGNNDTANQFCSLYKMMENSENGVKVSCSGSKITIEGYANIDADEDEEQKQIIGMTKEEFINTMSAEEGVTCK